MRALITGATGFIGSRLVRSAMAGGDEVVVVGRDAKRLEARFAGARAIAWDGTHLPVAALDGVDVVFHLSGESVAEGRWTPARKAAILDSRVLSTRSIVDAMRASPRAGRVLVCASAVGFYGSRGEEVLTEASAPGGDFLAGVCKAWEAEARHAKDLGARVANVRIGVVLAKDGGALAKMLPLFRAGVGGRLGDGNQWMPWIHVDDVVGLFLHAARDRRVNGPMNAVSPDPVTNAEFTRALGRVLSRPAVIPAPAFALRAALGEMSEVVLASQRVIPEVAIETAYAFRHPALVEALHAELDAPATRAAHA